MKIFVERGILLEGLQNVFSIVPQKPTLPILTNFLFKTTPEGLVVSGTDMDMSITTLLKCTVEEEGTIAVNAKNFLGVIRELPEGTVGVWVENERVTIDYEHGQSNLMGITSSDCPSLRDSAEGITMELSSSDLVE
ncbi:MAG TPA: DNA polymerase III subunit beta, partial [Anaerolineae bacterium]|nr:DNA polymerase III subunit beta [Anaerolineae bacterium]